MQEISLLTRERRLPHLCYIWFQTPETCRFSKAVELALHDCKFDSRFRLHRGKVSLEGIAGLGTPDVKQPESQWPWI